MCYLIAKDKDKHGSIALKTRHGEHLAQLSDQLDDEVKNKGIQIVTISRPSAYGEYAPYTFVKSEDEFRKLVSEM